MRHHGFSCSSLYTVTPEQAQGNLLIDLREQVRRTPERPAEEAWLDPLELEVLRIRTGRQISTVREVALAIGRLGGHLNRKGDGLPGWATLWRGMQTLSMLVEGVRLARKLTHFG